MTGGAGDEVRTRDIQLGRLTLCQLSYSRPGSVAGRDGERSLARKGRCFGERAPSAVAADGWLDVSAGAQPGRSPALRVHGVAAARSNGAQPDTGSPPNGPDRLPTNGMAGQIGPPDPRGPDATSRLCRQEHSPRTSAFARSTARGHRPSPGAQPADIGLRTAQPAISDDWIAQPAQSRASVHGPSVFGRSRRAQIAAVRTDGHGVHIGSTRQEEDR